LKSWKFGKEAPQIWPGEADAEAAKLKKFSDAGGDKFGGCPTTQKTNFSSHLGIKSRQVSKIKSCEERTNLINK